MKLEQLLQAFRTKNGIPESGSQPRYRPVNPVEMPRSERQLLEDKAAEIRGQGVNSGCREGDIFELAALELKQANGEKLNRDESARLNSLSQIVHGGGRC